MSTYDLIQALTAEGFQHIPDLKPGINRFPGIGKHRTNKSGWCWLFDDLQGATYGDYSTGLIANWQAEREKPLSPSERALQQQLIKEAQRQRKIEKERAWEQAALTARSLWRSSYKADINHPYLVKKHLLRAYEARAKGKHLVIPLYSTNGTLQSLQFIDQDGSKRFLKGGKITGGLFTIGEIDNQESLLICEGYATGCTLHEETGLPVACAFNAGNLLPAASAIRSCYPERHIIICGDDDRLTEGNPGRTKANQAAQAIGGSVAFPPWPDDAPIHLTDFNDLARWKHQKEVA